MNLEKLGKTVAKYAPILGAVLPIPGGELIGKAIQSVFGDNITDTDELIRKIENDPEASVKLRNIAMQERVTLEQLIVDKLRIENEDRANARQREIVLRDKTPSYMAIIFVSSYMIMMIMVTFLLKFFTLNSFEEKILEVMIANISNANMFILAYYFGSSNKK